MSANGDDGTSRDEGSGRTAAAADERTTDVTDVSDNDPVVTRMLEIFQQMVAGQTAVAISERMEDISSDRVQSGQLAALQALAQRMQAPDQGMDADQSRIEVRFRALQTSLGGASRVAHPSVPVLMPSPRLYSERLEFVTSLPKDAWTVVLSTVVRRGKTLQQEDIEYSVSDSSPDDVVLTQLVGTVVAVEVRDVHDRTLQFGIPLRAPDRRTASGRN
jgi:hypothetical protein